MHILFRLYFGGHSDHDIVIGLIVGFELIWEVPSELSYKVYLEQMELRISLQKFALIELNSKSFAVRADFNDLYCSTRFARIDISLHMVFFLSGVHSHAGMGVAERKLKLLLPC